MSVQLTQYAHRGCDILHMRFLSSLSRFFRGVLGHSFWAYLVFTIEIQNKNKNKPILQPKKRKKLSVSFRVCRFSKEGGRGGEAAAPVREEKSQQFGHDCILDPFRTRSANAT